MNLGAIWTTVLEQWAAFTADTTALLTYSLVAAFALGIIVAERIVPYRRQGFFREQLGSDFLFYTVLQNLGLAYLFALVNDWLKAESFLANVNVLAEAPVWAVVVGSLVVHDFYIYWFHRWQHYNRYLWRLHEAHHSTIDMDWLSGLRSHALEIWINQFIEFGALVLLGAPSAAIIIKGGISAVWGMWIHTNLDVRTGKLQYVINGPEMHRWHHADYDKDAYNVNFATKFAFWDWMFGSAYLPREKRLKHFGIESEVRYPKHWASQLFYLFRPFGKDEGAPAPEEKTP